MKNIIMVFMTIGSTTWISEAYMETLQSAESLGLQSCIALDRIGSALNF